MVKNIFIRICTLLLTVSFIIAAANETEHLPYGIPSDSDLLLKRSGFVIAYSKNYRQPLWVCYILSAQQLQMPKVRRRNKFAADPAIYVNPVKPADYRRSGYDRGHLAPAADMSYAPLPMKHSFYMSNISPQIPGCNRGIWKRLETQVRKWALREKKIYVITGPLFRQNGTQKSVNGIPVPDGFFKVVLDMTPPYKTAAFIIPNSTTRKRLGSFSVTVDHVEALTGFDFFAGLADEEQLEQRNDFKLWRH